MSSNCVSSNELLLNCPVMYRRERGRVVMLNRTNLNVFVNPIGSKETLAIGDGDPKLEGMLVSDDFFKKNDFKKDNVCGHNTYCKLEYDKWGTCLYSIATSFDEDDRDKRWFADIEGPKGAIHNFRYKNIHELILMLTALGCDYKFVQKIKF